MIKSISKGYNRSQQSLRALPAGIWVLGFASLFMDVSSELIHSLLPVFITTVLGASMITLGLVEGIAESTAAIVRVFSGVITDYLRRRKFVLVLGYALGAITKPIIPLASSISWVFAAHFVDRMGKGIRGAPRDALVADIAPPPLRGAAYGLRQTLDSIGSFIGPSLALIMMLLLANDIRAVMWIAVIPAFFSVAILIFYLREPEQPVQRASLTMAATLRFSFSGAKKLPGSYWLVVLLGAVFTLARFSEAFLILRAQDVGLSIAYVPLIMIVMNIFYAVFAFPAGAAADHFKYSNLLLIGIALLITADMVLAYAFTPFQAFIGAALWGLHMAFTQGLLSKLVADTAPEDLRGAAFGVFGLVTGTALLFASALAGFLWSIFGPSATFICGAAFATIAGAGLLAYRT